MANTCKTCRRNDVDEINQLLVSGVPLRTIANQIEPGGNIEAFRQSLLRHKDNCIEALFAEDREKRRSGLLAKVDDLEAEIDEVKAAFPDNPQARVQLIARRKEAIELEAKLTGAFIKDQQNPADVKVLAKKVVADLIAAGKSEEEATKFASERYGVLASELIG